MLHLELETAIAPGAHFERLETRGDHFGADAVTGTAAILYSRIAVPPIENHCEKGCLGNRPAHFVSSFARDRTQITFRLWRECSYNHFTLSCELKMEALSELTLFSLVAKNGSLSAAARELNVTPPAVTSASRSSSRGLGYGCSTARRAA